MSLRLRTLYSTAARCAAACLLSLLGACASQVSTDANGVHTSRCPTGGFGRCHDNAKRYCGRAGYVTLSEVSDRGSQTAASETSLISARDAVRILTFKCKTP